MDLYLVAAGLPQPAAGQIQDGATQYARTVVDTEWPLMAAHGTTRHVA